MLRYDTVTLADNVYHAFCLIAISDAGSDLTTLPQLTLEWDHATSSALPDVEHLSLNGEQSQDAANSRKVTAIKLYTYDAGEGKTSTFWRFKIEIPMAQHEEHVFYSVNAGPESSFVVPAIGQNFRCTSLPSLLWWLDSDASRGGSFVQRLLGWSRHRGIQRSRSCLA